MDSLLTLIKLEQQLKVVSQLLLEQEDRLTQQAENDDEKHSKHPQEKQDFEQSCRLKQKKIRAVTKNADKVEQTFIIKSKYRKVSDDIDNEDLEEDEVRVSHNKDKSNSRKTTKKSQKSREMKPESQRSSSNVQRKCSNERIESMVKEQKRRESSRKQDSPRQRQQQARQPVCINRNVRKVILSRARPNINKSSSVRFQRPSITRQCRLDRQGRKSRSDKPSPRKESLKVEGIKIEQVKRR